MGYSRMIDAIAKPTCEAIEAFEKWLSMSSSLY